MVNNVEKKASKRSPAPPFTTSTLQQEASSKLGFPVARTMQVAQQLYENGFITYMRTDSLRISDEALADEIDGKYDMITANIVADVLIAMKDYFVRYLKKGGILIISGIIEERMEEVLSAVESVGFIREEVSVKEGWAAAKYTI